MQAGHYKYLKHQQLEVTPHLLAGNSIMKVYQQAKNKNVTEVFNSYSQIPETISKKRAVTQGISRKLFPDFAILGRDSGDFPETISR